MLSVCIWGMPPLPEADLIVLTREIHEILKRTVEHSTDPNSPRICVFYQKDLMAWGLGEEVLIEIKGTPSTPARPVPVALYDLLARTVKSKITNCKFVECNIYYTDGVTLTYSA